MDFPSGAVQEGWQEGVGSTEEGWSYQSCQGRLPFAAPIAYQLILV